MSCLKATRSTSIPRRRIAYRRVGAKRTTALVVTTNGERAIRPGCDAPSENGDVSPTYRTRLATFRAKRRIP